MSSVVEYLCQLRNKKKQIGTDRILYKGAPLLKNVAQEYRPCDISCRAHLASVPIQSWGFGNLYLAPGFYFYHKTGLPISIPRRVKMCFGSIMIKAYHIIFKIFSFVRIIDFAETDYLNKLLQIFLNCKSNFFLKMQNCHQKQQSWKDTGLWII